MKVLTVVNVERTTIGGGDGTFSTSAIDIFDAVLTSFSQEYRCARPCHTQAIFIPPNQHSKQLFYQRNWISSPPKKSVKKVYTLLVAVTLH